MEHGAVSQLGMDMLVERTEQERRETGGGDEENEREK